MHLTGLDGLSVDQLTSRLSSIKTSGDTHLNVKQNQLYLWDEAKIRTFCTGLKECGITHLDMSRNALGWWDEAKIRAFCTGLKNSDITHLNMSENGLDEWHETQIRAFCTGLKNSGITHLDMSSNELDSWNETEIRTFCTGLKECSITHLNLSGNSLHLWDMNQLTVFREKLPENMILILDKKDSDDLMRDIDNTIGTLTKSSCQNANRRKREYLDLKELDARMIASERARATERLNPEEKNMKAKAQFEKDIGALDKIEPQVLLLRRVKLNNQQSVRYQAITQAYYCARLQVLASYGQIPQNLLAIDRCLKSLNEVRDAELAFKVLAALRGHRFRLQELSLRFILLLKVDDKDCLLSAYRIVHPQASTVNEDDPLPSWQTLKNDAHGV